MTRIVTIIPTIPEGPRMAIGSFPLDGKRTAELSPRVRRLRLVVDTQQGIRLRECGLDADGIRRTKVDRCQMK